MDDLISIIVPVYNTERYLPKCIDSLIKQVYQNIEIILVDDGSGDCSYEICKQYAMRDRRIKVIQQKNAGSTSARKKGLSCATGTYVTFIDSDDWIDREFCDELYKLAREYHADFVVSGCVKEFEDHIELLQNNFAEGYYNKKEMEKQIYPFILLQDRDGEFGILQYMCNKLYTRQLITCCLNRLDERIYNAEDAACVLDICLKADNMVVNNDMFYHYRIHENSICTSGIDESYFANAAVLYSCMKKTVEGYEDILGNQLEYVMARFINNGTAELFNFDYESRYGEWELPKHILYQGKKIALFGAGSVGKSYCIQLCDLFQVQDIQIFDNRLYGTMLYGFEVKSPDNICSLAVDYVIIAVCNEDARTQICEQLLDMAVPVDRIVSTQPIRRTEGYVLMIRK